MASHDRYFQNAEPQKCYHVIEIFEPQTEINGPRSGLKKSHCPCTCTSEINSKNDTYKHKIISFINGLTKGLT